MASHDEHHRVSLFVSNGKWTVCFAFLRLLITRLTSWAFPLIILISIFLLIIFAHPPSPYWLVLQGNRSRGGPGGLATGFPHWPFAQESWQLYYPTANFSTQNTLPYYPLSIIYIILVSFSLLLSHCECSARNGITWWTSSCESFCKQWEVDCLFRIPSSPYHPAHLMGLSIDYSHIHIPTYYLWWFGWSKSLFHSYSGSRQVLWNLLNLLSFLFKSGTMQPLDSFPGTMQPDGHYAAFLILGHYAASWSFVGYYATLWTLSSLLNLCLGTQPVLPSSGYYAILVTFKLGTLFICFGYYAIQPFIFSGILVICGCATHGLHYEYADKSRP
jgi:hypothetical protein